MRRKRVLPSNRAGVSEAAEVVKAAGEIGLRLPHSTFALRTSSILSQPCLENAQLDGRSIPRDLNKKKKIVAVAAFPF